MRTFKDVEVGSRLRLMALLLLVAFACVSSSQTPQSEKRIDVLYRLYSADLPRVDVAVLLDVSGSMLGKYDPVREAILAFSKDLEPTMSLHLRVFAELPMSALEGTGGEVAGEVGAYLPLQPVGKHGTDLGLAIEKALDFLERPNRAPVQALFLLTDGFHQPLPQSPYSRDFGTDPEWAKLRERAQRLARASRLVVYGFGIGDRTDVPLLPSLFPARQVELIPGSASGVGAALNRMRDRLRLEQVLPLLKEDLRKGGIVARLETLKQSPREGTRTLRATLTNRYRRLAVRVEGVRFPRGQTDLKMTFRAASLPTTLDPGESLSIDALAVAPESHPLLGRVRTESTAIVESVADAVFKDAGAIQAVNVGAEVSQRPLQDKVAVIREAGIPWWLLGLGGIGFLVSAFGLTLLRRSIPNPGLVGTLMIGSASIDLSLAGKQSMAVGEGEELDLKARRMTLGAGQAESERTRTSIPITLGHIAMQDMDERWRLVVTPTVDTQLEVNHQPASGSQALEDGDLAKLGRYEFQVVGDIDAPSVRRRPLPLALGLAILALALVLVWAGV